MATEPAPRMNCREFRDKHALLIDARCTPEQERALYGHRAECDACARHDTLIRRSLLIARNLPRIEPSPDFRGRLEARLSAATASEEQRHARLTVPLYLALAATIAFVTVAAGLAFRHPSDRPIRMQPVVATLPDVESAAPLVATPALVATVPTGMSVWPAIMVATQAPMHFVAAELATER